jgi:hypothetical protein
MSDEAEQISPFASFHYDTVRTPAQHPPGPIAPEPPCREPSLPVTDYHALVEQAHGLIRDARHPGADPAWPRLLDALLEWRAYLIGCVGDDETLAALAQFRLREVDHLLKGRS